MLSFLHIENIALIQEADMEPNAGFTSLTGETGAGKSILVDSIHFLSGSRAARELIRSGETTALVSGGFTGIPKQLFSLLAENGIPTDADDNCLILSRTMNVDGRGICKINGRTVPLSLFREVASNLVLIHGQNDSLALLNPDNHTAYLDSSGTPELIEKISDTKKRYDLKFAQYRDKLRLIKRIEVAEKEKQKRLSSLKFEISDISSASLKDGEENKLFERRTKLLNSEKLSSALKTSIKALGGMTKQRGASELLMIAAMRLSEQKELEPEFIRISEKLESMSYETQAILEEIKNLSDGFEDDPTETLNKLEARLDVIYRMKLKYGETEKAVLDYLDKIKKEYSALISSENEKKLLSEEAASLLSEAGAIALELTSLRMEAKRYLEERMTERLGYLDMQKTEFQAVLTPVGELTENGAENVEFYIKPNAGEPFKPLSKIASGGELSRIMLSLQTVLTYSGEVGTMVFDEIDTGVSGKTSRKIGLSLRSLGESRQILCVTHSAQVAAASNEQFKIEKREVDGRTCTYIRRLSNDERVAEIARIIGGLTVTDASLESARELLAVNIQ